jgi:hypothetical protein
MTEMAAIVEYMINEDLVYSTDPSNWPIIPNVEYYWAGAPAAEPHTRSEVLFSINRCPLWKVWGVNLVYAFTTPSCLSAAMSPAIKANPQHHIGVGMQLAFVRAEGAPYRSAYKRDFTPVDWFDRIVDRWSNRGVTTPDWAQVQAEHCCAGGCAEAEPCWAAGGTLSLDWRRRLQAQLDGDAMKRGSPIKEVMPLILGEDYKFKPMPRHLGRLQEAAVAAGCSGGYRHWGVVPLVQDSASGRWVFLEEKQEDADSEDGDDDGSNPQQQQDDGSRRHGGQATTSKQQEGGSALAKQERGGPPSSRRGQGGGQQAREAGQQGGGSPYTRRSFGGTSPYQEGGPNSRRNVAGPWGMGAHHCGHQEGGSPYTRSWASGGGGGAKQCGGGYLEAGSHQEWGPLGTASQQQQQLSGGMAWETLPEDPPLRQAPPRAQHQEQGTPRKKKNGGLWAAFTRRKAGAKGQGYDGMEEEEGEGWVGAGGGCKPLEGGRSFTTGQEDLVLQLEPAGKGAKGWRLV